MCSIISHSLLHPCRNDNGINASQTCYEDVFALDCSFHFCSTFLFEEQLEKLFSVAVKWLLEKKENRILTFSQESRFVDAIFVTRVSFFEIGLYFPMLTDNSADTAVNVLTTTDEPLS